MRLKRLFLYVLILSLVTVPVLAGGYGYYNYNGYSDRDPSEILSFSARHHLVKDRISGTAISQTYTASAARNYINHAGLLTAAVNNTPVIDHVGSSLTPYLRGEPQAMQLLFGPNNFSVAGGWTLSNATTSQDAVGPSGAANEAWTVTDTSGGGTGYLLRDIAKSASDSTTYFQNSVCFPKTSVATAFPLFGLGFSGGTAKYAAYTFNTNTGVLSGGTQTAGNIGTLVLSQGGFWRVYIWAQDNGANTGARIYFYPPTNGSCVIANGMLTTGSIPSSYFAGAAAIGDEKVIDGGFDAVTEAEAAAGVTVIGNCYKILQRTDIDYTADGAPDNNVGTYFNSTVGGATIDGSGGNDRLNNVTFTNWTGTNWAPQATAGALTGKALHTAGSTSSLNQSMPGASTGKVYRVATVIENLTAGSVTPAAGSTGGGIAQSSNGSYYQYLVQSGDTRIYIVPTSTFAGTIDSVSVKEHGTVRASEANTTTLAFDAAQTAALSGTTWQFAFIWRSGAAKGAQSADHHILSTASGIGFFTDDSDSDKLALTDGTNIATVATAYAANTDYLVVGQASAGKIKIGTMAIGTETSITWGSEANYDGSMNPTGLTIGAALSFPQWTRMIKLFNVIKAEKVLTKLRASVADDYYTLTEMAA